MDEDQEDIDVESAHHQLEIEARRWFEDTGASEIDLLKAWYEWCRESDTVRARKVECV